MSDRTSDRTGMRGLWLLVWVLGLTGCVYEQEPKPEVVYSPTVLEVERSEPQPEVQPVVEKPVPALRAVPAVPSSWVAPAGVERHWTAIVVHHSGTPTGNAEIFDQWHRERNHWDGVGYDFVIGNGSDSPDGEVEVTFRWRQQRAGAHCGGTPDNWANEEAVGICLVGDFNYDRPTSPQMRSLTRLVQFLQDRYDIPKSRIFGHCTTPGARVTECPGKRFPMAELGTMLGQ